MPLPRFRLRTLILTVAATALLCAYATHLRRRHLRFRALAEYHGLRSTRIGYTRADGSEDIFDFRGEPTTRDAGQRHWRRWLMYDHASRYPWLPILTDPPVSNRSFRPAGRAKPLAAQVLVPRRTVAVPTARKRPPSGPTSPYHRQLKSLYEKSAALGHAIP